MKRFFLFSIGFLMLAAMLSAGSPLKFNPRAGDWKLKDDRLYQNDMSTGALLAHLEVPQQGFMVYNFDVRYEGGAVEDGRGGFGIHLFVNDPASGNNSWGNGNSVLLWLNYDIDPYLDEIPAGLSAQVYHSRNNHLMELAGAFDLNDFAYLLTANASELTIPVKLKINGVTGQAWVTSPVDPSMEYTFNLGKKNLKGNYISLRTNSLAVSFGL